MSIEVSSISCDEYMLISKNLDIDFKVWNCMPYFKFYDDVEILISKKSTNILGIWIVPIMRKGSLIWAERDYRYFPYCAPIIFEQDNLKIREILKEFFKYLQKKCDSIYIPMDTYTTNISIIQSLGAVVEWRHTHVFETSKVKLSSRLKNHINNAQKNTKLKIDDLIENFNFNLAIKGSIEEVDKRKSLAKKLLEDKKGIIISAKNLNDELVSGVFILLDNECAYMLHTWQSDNTPRGTIALLIKTAIEYTLNEMKLQRFDLEGSVIQNVDYFFSGFNASIVPYGFVHWSKKESDLVNLILKSRNIEGRMIYNA